MCTYVRIAHNTSSIFIISGICIAFIISGICVVFIISGICIVFIISDIFIKPMSQQVSGVHQEHFSGLVSIMTS